MVTSNDRKSQTAPRSTGPSPLDATGASTLSPRDLVPTLVAGLVVGLIVANVAITIATLIFQGPLRVYLAQGIGLTLFSAVVITATLALFSSHPGMMGQAQDRVAAVYASIGLSLGATVVASNATEPLLPTVVATFAVTALVNGVLLWMLGRFHLGNLIRYIPYPVIGGFLAGTGAKLVTGSLGVMTQVPASYTYLPQMLQPETRMLLIAGIGFGLTLTVVTSRFDHYLVLPALLLGGAILVHAGLYTSGMPLDQGQLTGWLLGPFPSGGWSLATPSALAEAEWSAVLAQWKNMGVVFVITVFSVLLNSGSLELITRTDVDLNRELRTAGLANILIGAGGGTVGFQSLSTSRLVHRMGAQSRVVGLVGSLFCTGILASGTTLLSLFPRPILGGLLFFLGMQFLVDWIYDAFFRISRAEYVTVLLITATIVLYDYPIGTGVGVLACGFLFLVQYSRIGVVKTAFNGAAVRSNVDRPPIHARHLLQLGQEIHVLKLQGYLFFGSAHGLVQRVRELMAREEAPTYLVMDFKRVTGLDSSSTMSFMKILNLAERTPFTLVFTGLSPSIQRLLTREGFEHRPTEVYRCFENLDFGMEWCEDELLEREGITQHELGSFVDILADDLGDIDVEQLLRFFDHLEFEEGDALVEQGDVSRALYLIDRGRVTAQLSLSDGTVLRLRTKRSGTIVGEIGMILGEPRSASVIADGPLSVYALDEAALAAMEAEAPHLAKAFHLHLTRTLAERLSKSNRTLQVLLD